MFQTDTKNNEATFSRLVQVETRRSTVVETAVRSRICRFDFGGTAVSVIQENRYMGERTYLVDFRKVFEEVGPAKDLLYFYPHELEGFIESCVMATQRDVDITSRDIQIFRDLTDAMADWVRREEESSYFSNVTYNRNYSVEDYEIREATKIGAIIDDMVRATMSVIREVHGDYAVDERSLEWSSAHALKMRLRF